MHVGCIFPVTISIMELLILQLAAPTLPYRAFLLSTYSPPFHRTFLLSIVPSAMTSSCQETAPSKRALLLDYAFPARMCLSPKCYCLRTHSSRIVNDVAGIVGSVCVHR
jgi:hypothetical protein